MESIIQDLSVRGFHASSDYFTQDEALALLGCAREMDSAGRFRLAGIGRGDEREVRTDIRRDRIAWLDAADFEDSAAALFHRLEALKRAINAELYMGLWELEGHFAIYPPGGFYERHLDRFRSDDARAISIVVYLNPDWRKGDGGELRAVVDASEVIVEPRLGTMVCFLSDRIEHEVLPSKKERVSFAGWFKRRT